MTDYCGRDKFCVGCVGTGTISLPQKIISPGVVDLVLRTIDCPDCTNGYRCAGVDHYHKPADSLIPICSTCHLELPPKEVQNG